MAEHTEPNDKPPSTEADKIHAVLVWMLEGQSEHSIREAIQGNWPGEDAEPLILKAIRANEDGAAKTRERIESWTIEATKHIYTKCLAIGEYAGAMRAIKQLNELTSEPFESGQVANKQEATKGGGLKPNGLRIRTG